MTIRDFLVARQRRLSFLVLAARLVFATGGFCAYKYKVWWVPLPLIAPLVAVAIVGMQLLKCPRCGGAHGSRELRIGGGKKWFGRRMEFCPYCGVGLDEERSHSK
jgi:hypothetical protein